jgi:hypothetical protein
MIILPKEQPVIEGLNSYYLDVIKLLEHYQGEIGSGGIHFNSPAEEGVLFFDKDAVLSGTYQGKDGEVLTGDDAIDRLIDAVKDSNFMLDVYSLDPEKIYFWANMPTAEPMFRDLSTDFTDLDGLINKMKTEKLTGYIDASIKNGDEGGLVFFMNGEIIGGSFSWGDGQLNRSVESRNLLIRKTKESGAIFHVSKISLTNGDAESETNSMGETRAAADVIKSLQELLDIFERNIRGGRFIKGDFSTVLKKKFMEKADKYLFLDPFAGEFSYSNGKIEFTGDEDLQDVFKGVTESVKELAQELKVWPNFSEEIRPWVKKHSGLISSFGVSF